ATARGLAIAGRGGEVLLRKDGGLSARDLAFTSKAGGFELEGDLSPPRPGHARRFSQTLGKMHLHLHDIDLERVRAAVAPDARPVAGTLSADLHLVRDGRNLGIEGEIVTSGVAAGPRLPAIDATLRLNAGQGKVVAVGHARARDRRHGESVGIVDFTVDAEAPADLLDGAGWKKVEVDRA